MKSFYTLFAFLCFTTFELVAQPVITSDITPDIGDAWTGFFLQVDTMDYSPSTTGANTTWDFSGLADSLDVSPEEFIEAVKADPFLTFTAISTGDALFSENFPNADFAIRTFLDFIAISDIYQFIDERSDGLYGLGDVAISEFEFFGMTFIDTSVTINPMAELFIPFQHTFGDNFVRTSTSIEEDDLSGIRTESVTRDSFVADGYGTLITPFATYNNVLRWGVFSTTVEKQISIANGQVLSTDTNSDISYQWQNTNEAAPVLTYQLPDELDEEPLGTLIFFTTTSGISSTNDHPKRDNLMLNIAPNPVEDKVQVSFNLNRSTKQVNATLFDLQGRLVSYHSWGTLPAGEQNPTLELPYKLPNGTYILRILGEGLVGHQKVVVQR